jgi:flavin reductase (DIM6/NTAB) family NADH-FMN oxidoreductase RutF
MKAFISKNIDQVSDRYALFNALVAPRPIALVTTLGANGVVNVAPFSYFNMVCVNPPLLSVAVQRKNGQLKDTARNILGRKEFVVNICSLDMAKQVTITGGDYPSEVSEVEIAGLHLIPSDSIKAPRVLGTLAQLECTLSQSIEIGDNKADLILGEVIRVHLSPDILEESGRINVAKLNPLSRLAGADYGRTELLMI